MQTDREALSAAALLLKLFFLLSGGVCLLWGAWQGLVERHYAEATFYLVLFMVSGLGWNREH